MAEEELAKPVVAIVTPGTFKVPSDFSSSVERVVDEVSRRLAREANVIVYSKKTGDSAAREQLRGVTHIRPAVRTGAGYRAAVVQSLKESRPGLIQVENRPALAAQIKRAMPGAEVWLSLHSLTFVSPPYIRKRELARAFGAVDRIVVNSRFLGRALGKRVPRSRRKIVVNHLGTDVARFGSQWEPEGRKERQAYRQRLGYGEHHRIVVYAGRLLPIKGVHHLLAVWPKVSRKVPNAILLVVGSAFYGSRRLTPYVRRLHRMGGRWKRSVRFMSYVPYSDMPNVYRAADVVAVPSSAGEAFGLVNVEAMASGAPVVASRSGGISEVIRHGVNGYLIRRGSLRSGMYRRIVRLLSDRSLRRRLGEAGVRIARARFSWQRCAERQIALYRRYSHIFRKAGSGGQGG